MKLLKRTFSVTFSFLLFILVFATSSTLAARDYYQIKIYNLKDKNQETQVENYLKNAYLPALHRAGVKSIGVFKPIETDENAGKKIFVFIPIIKFSGIDKIEKALNNDAQYKLDGAGYINAPWENPPYQRIESIILKAFPKMPKFAIPEHTNPAKERIYELRSYEGPSEKIHQKKLEMFNLGGEVALFKKLDFQAIFYAEVVSGSAMPNLMYLTTFKDMKSHDEHWDAFRNHPDWKKLSGKEEYKHTVSHSDKYLLHPTEYSDL